jgi:type VI secretion system protein ImpF
LSRTPRPLHLRDSLWDRLTKVDSSGVGPSATLSGEIDRIKRSVGENLKWLLNSKRPLVDLPEGMTALEQSLVTYGLTDNTNLSPSNTHELERFQRELEAAIRRFEPRLSGVKVTFTPFDRDKNSASLYYRIDALLRLDPEIEPIAFNTILDLRTRAFSVKREGS